MTDRTTTYDSTTSRESRSGERTGSPGGVAAGAGATGHHPNDGSERDRARQAAEEIKTAAKEAAVSTAGAVRNRLSGELDYRKYRSRQRLERVANVLRQASTEVGAEDEVIGRYIEGAADRTQRLAEYLDQKGVTEIVHDAREMARRRPELFVGSLFIAGLALGRFLRSSAPNGGNGRSHDERDDFMGSTASSGVYPGSRSHAGTGASYTGASSAVTSYTGTGTSTGAPYTGAGASRPTSTTTPPVKPDGGLVP